MSKAKILPVANGDCYEVSLLSILQPALYAPEYADKELTLCHGEVVGQVGAVKGIKYGHAWLEFDWHGLELVLDMANGSSLCTPKAIYYKAGEIGTNIHRYSRGEARDYMMEFDTYGPWHLETESGV